MRESNLRSEVIRLLVTLTFSGCLLSTALTQAVDKLEYNLQGEVVRLQGQLLESGDPASLLLLHRNNKIQKLASENVLTRTKDATSFRFVSRDQMISSLREEFGEEFRIHQTSHYLVCFNTTPEYARWVATLMERLHRGFFAYWDKRRAAIDVPAHPLVVVIHKDQKSFLEHVDGDLGESAEFIPGYYNQESNRVNLYDLSLLTERQANLIRQGSRPGNATQQIRRVLDHPTAERNVATVIHEGTHQLCFNCGMMRRLSFTPLWLSEGMAIYFETPDLNNPKGWFAIGRVNRYNLSYFQRLEQQNELPDLEALICSDELFRTGQTVRAAYAYAWALNFYLQQTRPQQYREFVKMQRLHLPLKEQTQQQRKSMFVEAFGGNLAGLEQAMRQYLRRL
ncbi:MAG: hypothetical protein CMM06_09330 [Rhodopirellula sp.]|nr:hypothetical protein [Rhodopirellula sp.]MCH2600947.1 DUF1570 domain-containing protein [Pirellulales bacterium]|tara:strand:- start:18475 stop:19659 length:1185 start_codon:yes stop_codon:yes gene_type:complete